MTGEIDKAALLAHFAIAMFGGLASSLSKKQRRFVEVISNMVVGSFTGTVAVFVTMCVLGENNVYLNYAIAGSFGYLGNEGMKIIIEIVKKAIKVNIK